MTDTPRTLPTGGFWARSMALTIDGVLLWLPTKALETLPDAVMAQVLSLLLIAWYYVLFLGSRWQATPGMRMYKLEMRTASGERMTIWRAIDWLGMSLFITLVCLGPMLYVLWLVLSVAPLDEMRAAMRIGADPSILAAKIQQQLGMTPESLARTGIYGVLSTLFLLGFWCLSTMVMKGQRGVHNWLARTVIVKVER